MGCTTAEEAALTASHCDVTVLNFGTPTTRDIANAVLNARVVVVDPVGCGLETRGKMVKAWLEARRTVKDTTDCPITMETIVKANRSEIEALIRLFGVDGSVGANLSVTPESSDCEYNEDTIYETLFALSAELGGMWIVMTGRVDYIAHWKGPHSPHLKPHYCAVREYDSPMLQRFSGAGCCLGAFLAAVGALELSNAEELRSRCREYRKVAADVVRDGKFRGPASFQVAFFDGLANANFRCK
jgi:hydroxyethylthiazole kinase